ncbi:hypothetical protein HYC85_030665 [Camellia sinensis]|uniref:non-specific serine/threonine protein kinase n=1 Tax=Camellia sinensis TaxID=4442 RepID=A0A7J7G581_CAMSI|nr:hypothetical protein HYC85_030665 [Camellia sinensis]
MRGMAYVDISYNELQGPIPMSNAFMNASIEALQGNKDLCGNVNIVAVKKLHPLSKRLDRKDFLNEVRALTEIKHQNIVKLFGFSSHALSTLKEIRNFLLIKKFVYRLWTKH